MDVESSFAKIRYFCIRYVRCLQRYIYDHRIRCVSKQNKQPSPSHELPGDGPCHLPRPHVNKVPKRVRNSLQSNYRDLNLSWRYIIQHQTPLLEMHREILFVRTYRIYPICSKCQLTWVKRPFDMGLCGEELGDDDDIDAGRGSI
jgi:hypothetical protein